MGILLAEEGHVRANQVEHLVDHLQHAGEMGGARLALQKGRHRPGIDPHERLARVDLRCLGGVDGLNADRAEKGEVGSQIARVLLVILIGPELQGVDEDRDDDVVGRFAGGAHKREVPLVERPHGHDERARPLQGSEGGGQFGLGACNFCHAHQSTGRGRGRFTRRKRCARRRSAHRRIPAVGAVAPKRGPPRPRESSLPAAEATLGQQDIHTQSAPAQSTLAQSAPGIRCASTAAARARRYSQTPWDQPFCGRHFSVRGTL